MQVIKRFNVKNNTNKWGVYKLGCGSCPKVYVGLTSGSFKKRGIDNRFYCWKDGLKLFVTP